MFKKRTRTISFRVSEEEYHVLRDDSLRNGAHSVSDYARALTCRDSLLEGPLIKTEVRVLRAQVQEIEREISRLQILVQPNGK